MESSQVVDLARLDFYDLKTHHGCARDVLRMELLHQLSENSD